MKATAKQYTVNGGRRLQDFLDYSIRQYDELGRVVSGALKDPVRSRLTASSASKRSITSTGRLKYRLLDFGV